MKSTMKLSAISGIILITLIIVTSCTVSEKAAVQCPDFYGNSSRHAVIKNKRTRNVSYAVNHKANRKQKSAFRMTGTPEKGWQNSNTELVNFNLPVNLESPIMVADQLPVKAEFVKTLTASTDISYMPQVNNGNGEPSVQTASPSYTADPMIVIRQSVCDTLVLKTGLRIPVIIDEIGQDYIKYRECGNDSGPLLTVLKSVVSEIKILDGGVKSSYMAVNNPPAVAYTPASNIEPAKIEGFGVAGFLTSIAGLIIAGIPLGAVSIVFGGLSLGKIRRDPGRWRGKGLGIVSIILGIVDIIGALIAISML